VTKLGFNKKSIALKSRRRLALFKKRLWRSLLRFAELEFPIWHWQMLSPKERLEIKSLLRPGDILLESNDAYPLPQIVTMLLMDSNWIHSAIYVGDSSVIDSGKLARVSRIDLDQFLNTTDLAVYRPQYETSEDASSACAYAIEHLGAPFNATFDISSRRSFYCTQLISKALLAMPNPIKLPTFRRFRRDAIPPAAVEHCMEIERIWSSEPRLLKSLSSHWPLLSGGLLGAVCFSSLVRGGLLSGALFGTVLIFMVEKKMQKR